MNAATGRSETMGDLLHRYEPYLQSCRNHILARLKTAPAAAVLAAYFAGGKMLRALLVFLVASAIGSDPRRMVMAAAALELLHGASLIHDDIVDDAAERRGRPALHRQVGLGPALVLGDYLMVRSFAVLRETETIHDSYRVLEAIQTLNYYAQACCLGEVLELQTAGRPAPEETYLAIVRGKTASQFAAAAVVPAILGRGTPEAIEALRAYGLNLGVAYQIRDDVLDLVGETDLLGKPAGNSLAKGRPLLPLIYLERYGSTAARRVAVLLAKEQNDVGRTELARLLNEEGILTRVKETEAGYRRAAVQSLDRLGSSDHTVALALLASCITTDYLPSVMPLMSSGA